MYIDGNAITSALGIRLNRGFSSNNLLDDTTSAATSVKTLTLATGQTYELAATEIMSSGPNQPDGEPYVPGGSTPTLLKWSTSSPNVIQPLFLTSNANRVKLLAVSAGVGTITVTDGTYTGSLQVIVTATPTPTQIGLGIRT